MAYLYLEVLLAQAESLLSRIKKEKTPSPELGKQLESVSEEIRCVLEDMNTP